MIEILQNVSERSPLAARVGEELGDWFRTMVSTRQGNPILRTTIISYLERLLDPIKEKGTGVSVHGYKINNLKFADDIGSLEEARDELQENLKRINEAGEDAGLKINNQKTMTMIFEQLNIIEELN